MYTYGGYRRLPYGGQVQLVQLAVVVLAPLSSLRLLVRLSHQSVYEAQPFSKMVQRGTLVNQSRHSYHFAQSNQKGGDRYLGVLS